MSAGQVFAHRGRVVLRCCRHLPLRSRHLHPDQSGEPKGAEPQLKGNVQQFSLVN